MNKRSRPCPVRLCKRPFFIDFSEKSKATSASSPSPVLSRNLDSAERESHNPLQVGDSTARTLPTSRPILSLQRTRPSGHTATSQALAVPGGCGYCPVRNTSAAVQQRLPRPFLIRPCLALATETARRGPAYSRLPAHKTVGACVQLLAFSILDQP